MVVIVVEVSVAHPQRPEQPLPGVDAQGRPGRALDDPGDQEVARVAVQVLAPGREVRLTLARDHVERFLIGIPIVVPKTGEPHEGQIVPDPARVVEQHADRHRHAVLGHLRQVGPDIIIQRELAALLREDHYGCRELFRDGADAEHARRAQRLSELQVGHAIAARVDEHVPVDDPQRAAGGVRTVVLGEHAVPAWRHPFRGGDLLRDRFDRHHCGKAGDGRREDSGKLERGSVAVHGTRLRVAG